MSKERKASIRKQIDDCFAEVVPGWFATDDQRGGEVQFKTIPSWLAFDMDGKGNDEDDDPSLHYGDKGSLELLGVTKLGMVFNSDFDLSYDSCWRPVLVPWDNIAGFSWQHES